MKKIKNTVQLYEKTHSVRLNQALVPFGVGAMVDFIDQTLMAAAPEYWPTSKTIHDERLEKTLGVDEFRIPPDSGYINGLPFVRFPEWYFCPVCRRFQPLSEWDREYKQNSINSSDFMRVPRCQECRVNLVTAGIITICEDGHINDFPWVKWTHYRSKKSVCSNPKLKLKTASSALGLEGLQIECTTCGAKSTMKGAFNDKIFQEIGEGMKCDGNMPWKGKNEKCNLYPKTSQRGALNVYFPKIETSIVIPPYSDELNVLIEESREFNSLISALAKSKKRNRLEKFLEEDLEDYIIDIADEINKNKDAVEVVIKRKFINSNEEQEDKLLSRNKYREEEYGAIKGNIPIDSMNSRDFKIEDQNIFEYNMSQLSKVVLIKKLREVRALVGFTRINPPENTVIGFSEDNTGKSTLIRVKEENTNWYPAYEARGEGIFIELNNEKVLEWINTHPEIISRAEDINKRFNLNNREKKLAERNITPKFLLLHTLAHLLIRELSFECGYSAASLQERIYCNQSEEDKEMSGILIYTSSGDSEGTLGGLVRQGYSDFLPKTIKSAVEKAKWCSLDPVCMESNGQGRNSLNLAACHACTLLPETSCEEFNTLLDRAVVVGTFDKPEIGFFSNM